MDHLALQKAIIESPHNIETWLIYADYLQMNSILEGDYLALFFKLQEEEKQSWWSFANELNRFVAGHWQEFNGIYWPAIQDAQLYNIPIPSVSIIPPGKFLMGSAKEEVGHVAHEKLHKVIFNKAFAMSHYPVTLTEYDFFCKQTHRHLLHQNIVKRDNYPVTDMNWYDAYTYCDWLSKQTGQRYRLPTEAEWEYACRAGTTTPFWWGESIDKGRANYDTRQSYLGNIPEKLHMEQILLVKNFYPNPWQLFQMHGNIWEWTRSYYNERYNGEEVLSADEWNYNRSRSVRGGSSANPPNRIRSAFSYSTSPNNKDYFIGFRIVREL